MTSDNTRFYYKGNRLKQLKAFCHAVRLGSLSRAADALFLSQPAISLQIGALEKDFGVRLLERQNRRVTLTPDGQMLYDLAAPLIEGIEHLDQSFREKIKGLDAGELNIAAGTSTIQYLLPDLVRRFREQYPSVHLHLHNVTGKDGLSLLRNDVVDFAFGSMLETPNDLSYEAVHHFDPILITPRDHPLTKLTKIGLEEISQYGLILPPKRLSTYRLIDMVFQSRKMPYKVALEVGGWEVIKQYVAMGLGISIVTSICLSENDQLAQRNMRQFFPPRSYGVVVRKGKFLSPQARAFIDLVKPGLFTRRDYFEAGHSER